jgi:tetratricopeptide (TPR) repeat protein
MLASFDGAQETNRVASSADARKRAVAAREDRKTHPETRALMAENPVTTRLVEIQKTIDTKNYAKADTDLRQLLTQNPSEPRIHYNLGRVAGLIAVGIEDPEKQAQKLLEAKVAYSNVLRNATSATDRALLSLTYVALGRIYEFSNENAYAIKLYDEAIKIDDVRGGGYSEAIAAKQRLLKP